MELRTVKTTLYDPMFFLYMKHSLCFYFIAAIEYFSVYAIGVFFESNSHYAGDSGKWYVSPSSFTSRALQVATGLVEQNNMVTSSPAFGHYFDWWKILGLGYHSYVHYEPSSLLISTNALREATPEVVRSMARKWRPDVRTT